MKCSSILTTIAALAITVSAIPTAPKESSNQCAGDQIVACCNTSKSKQTVGNGVLGLVNVILAPGSCSPAPVVGAVLAQYCGSNVAQCCNNNQAGLINVNAAQCVAIPL